MGLTDVITQVARAMADVIGKSEALKQSANIVEVGQFFKLVSEERRRLEKLAELLGSIENEYSTFICPTLLDGHKVDNITIGGRRIAKGVRLFASIPAVKAEFGHKWLRSMDYGEIIKETVHPKTLSSAMKAYIIDKGMLPPDNAITCYIQEYTTIKQG